MPIEFTDEIRLLLFVQSLKFAHVWMHKLNTFIMPDLLLCKAPAINIALMRSARDIFYSMHHLYRLLYRPSWIIIISNLSLSICIWNICDEVRLRAEMTLQPFFLHDGKMTEKILCMHLQCLSLNVIHSKRWIIYREHFFWQLFRFSDSTEKFTILECFKSEEEDITNMHCK